VDLQGGHVALGAVAFGAFGFCAVGVGSRGGVRLWWSAAHAAVEGDIGLDAAGFVSGGGVGAHGRVAAARSAVAAPAVAAGPERLAYVSGNSRKSVLPSFHIVDLVIG